MKKIITIIVSLAIGIGCVFGQDITSVKNIQKTKRQLFPKVLIQNNL